MKKDRAAFAVHQLKEQGLTLATCESLTGGMLVRNLVPIVLFALLVALGLWRLEAAMVTGFLWFGRFVVAVITVGLAAAVFTELTGVRLISGVGGGVVKRLGHVVPLSDDPALADHNGSYRDFILVEGRSGLLQSLEHVFFIDVHRVVRIQKRQAAADLP